MSTTRPLQLPDVPLLEDDDSYLVSINDDSLYINITDVLFFSGNQNVKPCSCAWYELAPSLRTKIVSAVQRRYKGRIIAVNVK